MIGRAASASGIAGPTVLPPGFAHPHASREAREIAEAGLILRTQVGSGVHGTSMAGQDDRDEMGICLEPSQFVTGLARVPNGVRGEGPSVAFEQYERHTAWDRPGGLANRSGAGRITLPVPEPHREYLRSIRRGDLQLTEVIDAITGAEAKLAELRHSSAAPDQPDRRWVDAWLHRSYLNFWAAGQ